MIVETDDRNQVNRLLVMASCLTSERHGGVLAALSAGARTFDEIAAGLPLGTGRERLLMLLRELCDAGFVTRSTKAGPPLRDSFQLTGDGRKMVDLTTFVSAWLTRKEEDAVTEPFWKSIRSAAARASSAATPREAFEPPARGDS